MYRLPPSKANAASIRSERVFARHIALPERFRRKDRWPAHQPSVHEGTAMRSKSLFKVLRARAFRACF